MLVFWFFFSSRRRHTRCRRDWSSDVCSSDLEAEALRAQSDLTRAGARREDLAVLDARARAAQATEDLRSEERRVGKSVDLGGRRIIKKKKKTNTKATERVTVR